MNASDAVVRIDGLVRHHGKFEAVVLTVIGVFAIARRDISGA